ncbi:MAG: hypothetical protein RJA22_1650, partial [Verrucomicrobiota bacterium]
MPHPPFLSPIGERNGVRGESTLPALVRLRLPALLVPLLLLSAPVWSAEPWTLERALQQAHAQNPDARLARQRLAAAQAGLEQANAAFWPKAQIQSSYTRTDNPMFSFGNILNQRAFSPSIDFNDVPDTDNLNVRGAVTVPLYAGGRHTANRQAAQAGAAAARQDSAAVHNALAFEVTRAFLTVLKARQFVAATEATVRSFATNRDVAARQMDAGRLLKSDVLDLDVRLAQAREDAVRARNGLALSEQALRNLLGLAAGGFAVADQAPEASVPESQDVSQRPELAAAEQREAAALAAAKAARSGYQPQVSAFGSYDYDRGWELDGEGRHYAGGLVAQWDLWDGLSTRAKSREAQANLEMARETQAKLRLALDLELSQARLDLQAATERLAVSEAAVDQAAESAQLTRNRFAQGLALTSR